MRISRIYWSVIVSLCLGGDVFLLNAEGEVEDGYPSKTVFDKKGPRQDIGFVLVENPDMRLLFCGRPLLKKRINRSVCVVDDARKTLVTSVSAPAREIEIGESVSVHELLGKIGLSEWYGGQPQLRIVKRDAMIQSPLLSDTSTGKPAVAAFLNQEVEPGDFLIITPKS